jgi:hypothetical protein
MKNIYLIFTLFLLSTSKAQNFNCTTINNLSQDINYNRSIDALPYDSTTPYVLNMYITLIDDSFNYHYNNYTGIMDTPEQCELTALNCIRILNINFNPSGIFFKYAGYKKVIDDAIALGVSLQSYDIYLPYKEQNTMNLYIVDRANGGNLDGTQIAVIGGNESEIATEYYGLEPFRTYSLIHNIAHNLSLYHTYETGNHYDSSQDLPNACEHVTRDITNSFFNANVAGDEVVDTAAQPQTWASNFEPNCGTYIYNANLVNCAVEPYVNIVQGNYMSTNFFSTCKYFSAGQTVRMRKYIQYNTGDFNVYSENTVRNDTYSLYQPFSIIAQSNNNTQNETYAKTFTPNIADTGVNVLHCGPFLMRFQPGFDCEFSSLPNTISQTVNDQFNSVCTNGVYIGVKIPILSQIIINALAPVCFNTFEPYTHGDIKSTTNLSLPYYTVEQLDEIRATDPEWYEKLQSTKYHIITKETDSGYRNQKVIYKN